MILISTLGNRKMINIRDTLLDNLGKGDKTAPDYDVARLYCGQFLHMAQSFYSNTNWIELNRWLNGVDDEDTITTSSDLGNKICTDSFSAGCFVDLWTSR